MPGPVASKPSPFDAPDSLTSFIAAGVSARALSTYMGHANIVITIDRYGHLMPGTEGGAAALLGAFLAVLRGIDGEPADDG